MMKIGIVGYSNPNKFNYNEGYNLVKKTFEILNNNFEDIIIVSGLSDVGIPGIAYHLAKEFNWLTVGIAPYEVYNHQLFPVDKKVIVGNFFGDESDFFLKKIDMLLAFGGGEQTKKELEKFKNLYPNKFCHEFKL